MADRQACRSGMWASPQGYDLSLDTTYPPAGPLRRQPSAADGPRACNLVRGRHDNVQAENVLACSSTFSGLTSRWMMPARCIVDSADRSGPTTCFTTVLSSRRISDMRWKRS